MPQITTNMTEEDYNYWINEPPTPFMQRCLKAYEAEHNKIQPGDWFTIGIMDHIRVIRALTIKSNRIDSHDGVGYNPIACTKVSPELQKLLDKETEQS